LWWSLKRKGFHRLYQAGVLPAGVTLKRVQDALAFVGERVHRPLLAEHRPDHLHHVISVLFICTANASNSSKEFLRVEVPHTDAISGR
jgi:hypothetical protein